MKKQLLAGLVAGVMAVGMASGAHATVLDFEGLGNISPIPYGYGGLDWSNLYTITGTAYPGSGYDHGVVSGTTVAFNSGGFQASASSGADFDFIGVYLTAAWNEGLNITVSGFDDGDLKYSVNVVATVLSPTFFNFQFVGIDELVFDSFGGLHAGLGGYGTHFAMDDFTFQGAQPVPEPAAMLLMGAGLAGLIAARRKKNA